MSGKRFILFAGLMLILAFTVPALAHDDMAQVRFGHFVAGAPNVDVFVNGEAVLEDVAPAVLSDFLEFEPGTLAIAISPAGEGMDAAIVSAELDAEADHNYSVSVIGQVSDSSYAPLVIDETAEMADCDLSKNVFRILINNIENGPPISFYENDMWIEKNIEYGTYAATCAPAFFWDTGKAVVGEDLDNPLFDFDSEKDGVGGFWEPYTVYMWGLMGKYPGNPGEDYDFGGGNLYVVAPDLPTFLSAFTGLGLTSTGDPIYEFDTFVSAIDAADLSETLANDGPFTIFAPPDSAFDVMPDKDMLLNHIVQGAMTYDDLAEAGTVTTLGGADLTITASEDDGATFGINGLMVSNFAYPLPDGSLVYIVDDVIPAE